MTSICVFILQDFRGTLESPSQPPCLPPSLSPSLVRATRRSFENDAVESCASVVPQSYLRGAAARVLPHARQARNLLHSGSVRPSVRPRPPVQPISSGGRSPIGR